MSMSVARDLPVTALSANDAVLALVRPGGDTPVVLAVPGRDQLAPTAYPRPERRPVFDQTPATGLRRGRTCFVFDGNGSQWAGMGCELLESDAVFRSEVTTVDRMLTPMLGWSVLDELTNPNLSSWDLVDVSQPLLFAVQAGMVASLAARGVVPQVVTGHSVGEVAAAYCAGMLDLHTACWVVVERTRAQAATAGTGRMAVLGLGAPDAENLLLGLGTDVVVAAANSQRDVTLCGSAAGLLVVGEHAERQGLFFRDIGLDYPYHGPAMDAVRDMLVEGLAGMAGETSRMPMISALTGERVTGPELDGLYWWRNLRYRVSFTDAIDRVVGDQGCDVLVEVGPHPVLGTYLRRMTEDLPDPVIVVPTMSRKNPGVDALDAAQLRLMEAGVCLDWTGFHPELTDQLASA